MHYQILAAPSADPAKQADEFARLIRHSRQLTLRFVTVAGDYKPARARLTLLSVPERVAAQAECVLSLLCGRDDATKPSAALRPRAEWRHHALLLPTDPAAPPPDGALLEGWHSACLTVTYRAGRALARLAYCPEDRERAAQLRLPGWQVLRSGPLGALAGSRSWRGLPSLAPVPGGAPIAQPKPADPSPEPDRERASALVGDESGLLLGLSPAGAPVRLARRAMTLAVQGDLAERQHVLLALARHAVQAGMGLVLAVDRALLPADLLLAWEPRTRLLDTQNIADSCAIPWQKIVPSLLAQAIGGAQAELATPPARFADALDALGASALRTPELLGLVAPPGDDLRGVLAAGGIVVAPQDGDAASAVVARLLLAYLATPPEHPRALLLLLDPALVPPETLRQQAIQVVFGPRSDALLELRRAAQGWQLCDPAGACVAELQPNLLAQPGLITGALADSIARTIGADPPSWWAQLAPPDDDDVEAPDTAGEADTLADADQLQVVAVAPDSAQLAQRPAHEISTPSPGEHATTGAASELFLDATAAQSAAEPAAGLAADPAADELDDLLGELLQALLEAQPQGPTELQIQQAARRADYTQAEELALAWQHSAAALAQPWLWQVVLVAEHADRATAARHAIALALGGPYAPLVRRALALLGEADGAISDRPDRDANRAGLSDDALFRAWRAGSPITALAEQLVAAGLDLPAARARVRAVLAQRPPAQPADTPAHASPNAGSAPNTSELEQDAEAGMNAIGAPIMPDAPIDDELIWRRWQANEPTDALVQSLCGRRGGPRADAARDRIYAVVIPRVVAQLGAGDLVAAMVAGQSLSHDPRFQQLLQRLARSAQPPMGMLDQSLRKRLVAMYQQGSRAN